MVQPTESIKFSRPPVAVRAWYEPNPDLDTVLPARLLQEGHGPALRHVPEALGDALCFGWIDGVRHSLDAESCTGFVDEKK